MGKLSFISNPFPDNNDGFDYAPKSFQDVQHEDAEKLRSDKESKFLSMLLSILK